MARSGNASRKAPASAAGSSARPRRAHLTGRHFVISWERPTTDPTAAAAAMAGSAPAGPVAAGPTAAGIAEPTARGVAAATTQRPPTGSGARPKPARPMMAVPKKLLPSSPLRNAVRRVLREAVRAAGIAPLPPMLVRLVSLPECEPPPAGARRAFERRLPDGAFKRACRADADALLARLAKALAAPRAR